VTGNGISCPGTCSRDYFPGTNVSLTAQPGSGFEFSGWAGACSGTGTCDLTITNTAADVTATFIPIPHTLTATVNGSGTVTGNGISCPGTCSKIYDEGTSVSLAAAPAAGFAFTGWTGACSGTGTCDLTMANDKDVTATFTAIPHTLTVTVKGKGHVSGNGISCPGTCSKIYDEGTAMSLSAQPAAGFKFAGWSGACTGQAACQFMITKDSAVTATFKLVPVCVVPKVKGNALSRAETLIRAAHCAVGNVTRPPHSKGKKLIVGSTKPGAGTRHPAGTKVAIALVVKR
jgi:uncharacterized repeat protein (TIGR02543 family)